MRGLSESAFDEGKAKSTHLCSSGGVQERVEVVQSRPKLEPVGGSARRKRSVLGVDWRVGRKVAHLQVSAKTSSPAPWMAPVKKASWAASSFLNPSSWKARISCRSVSVRQERVKERKTHRRKNLLSQHLLNLETLLNVLDLELAQSLIVELPFERLQCSGELDDDLVDVALAEVGSSLEGRGSGESRERAGEEGEREER